MKCPNCLTTMKCISEIHHVPGQPGRERMDLHCIKPIKGKDYEGRGCELICHMGVITEDPKVWECHEYNFEFVHDNKKYWLSSQNYSVDPFHQGNRVPGTALYDMETCIPNSFGIPVRPTILKLPFFIPISTGDDMHEDARALFERLRDLVIFS